MSPPRPTLDWDVVVDYSYLSQFELLRDCREDVRQRPWAVPAARLVAQSYLKARRAEEEIARLNIEVRRLYTWLRDEYWALTGAMQGADPLIAKEIGLLVSRHVEASGVQQHRIMQIVALPGYTGGDLDGGTRNGLEHTVTGPASFAVETEDVEFREAELRPRLPEDDEEVSDELARLDDYVQEIE
jgi:hypothetical protein